LQASKVTAPHKLNHLVVLWTIQIYRIPINKFTDPHYWLYCVTFCQW